MMNRGYAIKTVDDARAMLAWFSNRFECSTPLASMVDQFTDYQSNDVARGRTKRLLYAELLLPAHDSGDVAF
jgi:hypothetical protein